MDSANNLEIDVEEISNNKYEVTINGVTHKVYAPNSDTAIRRAK